MKKYFAKGLGFLVLGSLFMSTTVLALDNPTTQPATDLTITSATLNGTNGDSVADVGSEAFWYGPTSVGGAPFVVGSLPPGWTGGFFADTFSPSPEVANGNFSRSLTGLTPNTTYYYVAWVSVGSVWYPGTEQSFTTLPNSQTIVFDSVSPKTYGDGTFVVSATGGASGNPVTFGASGSCTVAGATVTIVSAGDCTITANQAAGGAYLAANPTDLIIPVAKKSLTITSGVTVDSKEYDKTTPATLAFLSPVLSGVVMGDEADVSVNVASPYVANFNNSNVGTGKAVTITGIALTGAKASNYNVVQPSLTGDITPISLVVTAVPSTKVYDQTPDSSDLPSVTGIIISGDVPDFFQSYDNKNVGTGKNIIPDGEVDDGNSGNNYDVDFVSDTVGIITKETLNVTPSALDKVYDALTDAVVSFSDDHYVGDDLTLNGTAQFLNKLVGMGKLVQITSFNSSGPDSVNYTPNVSGSLLFANVTAAPLTPVISVTNKVYDGNNTAVATCTVPALGTDVVTCTVGAATFSDQNVGNGKTVTATGITIGGADAGNYTVVSTVTGTGDITPKSVTVDFTADNKVYDGNDSATILTKTASGMVGLDAVNVLGGTATFNNKNVGVGKTVTATGFTLDNANYSVGTINTTTANVTAKTLAVTATGVDKMYDGTVGASVVYGDDRVSGDVFNPITGTATFADKHVGNNKTVSVTGISVTGTDAGNYIYNTTTSTTADIDVRPITVTAQANTKVYNATTSASALPVVSVNTIATGDSAVLSETYDTKDVGTGKTMTPAIVITDGNSGANYAVTLVNSTNGTITQAPATVSFTASNKVYDQNTSATILTRTVTGNIAPDAVITATGGTATFNNKNVGNGKAVSASGFSLDNANYFVSSVTGTTANITPKSLLVTASALDKMYDGTNSATVSYSDDRLGSDDITVSGTALFTDKHVANNKTVNVTGISLSGTDAGNYTPNTTTSDTADISVRPITVTAQTNTKVYDGNTSSVATPAISVNTIATGDTAVFSQTYDDKTVATGKTLTPMVVITDGVSGANYAVTFVNNNTGVITAKTLTVSATGVNKVYDANTNATVNLSDNRVGGDTLTTSYTSASFADKNIGTAKPVSVSGISVTGTDAGNYTFNTTANTTANITAKTLTITSLASNKVYDGNNVASVVLSNDAIGGDDVVVTDTGATFANKNVGGAKVVTSNFTVSGADLSNYTATASPILTTANITPKTLTISAAAQDKTEDGTTLASVTLSNDALAGDVVTQTFTSANFDNALVGSGKTVTVLGIVTAGLDAGNYTANTTATTTANINPQPSNSGSRPNGGGSSRTNVSVTPNTPAGQVLGAEKFNFTVLLKQGASSNEVMELQKFLNANNFGPLVADGKFGPKTKAAVIRFQLANGLVGDGVVGPKTRAILNK